MKVSVLRYAAIGMATLSLAGFAAASSVDLGTTGPHSTNKVSLKNSLTQSVSNHNNVGVGNIGVQLGQSGNVNANNNTTAKGDLSSGSVDQTNSANTTVSIDNTGSSLGVGSLSTPDDSVSFKTTGPNSNNQVTIDNSAKLTQTNNNQVQVLNFNLQAAKSGNVSAHNNTTVGGLSSGDVSNTNSSTTTVKVNN